LAKYSTQDWEPIVRFLRAGKSKIPEITAAIEGIGSTTRKQRSRAASQAKEKAPAKPSKAKPKRKPLKGAAAKQKPRASKASKKTTTQHVADEHLEAWTRVTLADRSTSELQELYFKAVGSKRIPVGRDAVIRALMEFLRRSSVEQRALLVNLLQRRSYDETEDYRRWTAMISRVKTNR
jgi:hypothetical protein